MIAPRDLVAYLPFAVTLFASGVLAAELVVAHGVDAAGKDHAGKPVFPGLAQPWLKDCIAHPAPDYPHEDTLNHREGDGLFRVSIDVHSGAVTDVRRLKSAGSASLDNSAISAIRKWRWKPMTWKEVDIPIFFHVSSH